ncbi:SAV_915 family protein [Streptomyces sp. NPDC049577]|uniref:SAV_915 family protein n=1 Tax=Streptomyces sp. NPDC049577 TaxID=3155153 RepID=UPI00341EC7FE
MSRTPQEAAAVAAVTGAGTGTGTAERPEDGEPSHPVPVRPLYVPVRPCPGGYALRVFRSPLGTRTAVAFTSGRRLSDCLGHSQPCVRLSLPAVRALAAPLGVDDVCVDPQLTAPPVASGLGSEMSLLPLSFPS